VIDRAGEWVGLVGALAPTPAAPTHLLVVMALPQRQTPIEAAVPLAAIIRISPGEVVIGATRDSLLGASPAQDKP